MRRLVSLAFALVALPLAAQQAAPKMEPIPEPPPPPPGYLEAANEPQVTIVKRGQDKVEEYRVGNKLYMMKVTPPHGPAYYLVDIDGSGQMLRRDSVAPNINPPMWVIGTF
jgi:hypothetical protein